MSDKADYSSTRVPTTVTSYDDGFSDSSPVAVEAELAEANIPEAAKAVALDAESLGDAAIPSGVETSALVAPDVSSSVPTSVSI